MLTRLRLSLLLSLLLPLLTTTSLWAQAIPEGKTLGPFVWRSTIFPGTERNYWLYVPTQYDGTRDACVMVVQDGLGRAKDWGLTKTMDQLIATKEMPVTIGVFIDPGVVPAPSENAQPRFNRSFEYDSLGDRYARFLLEEILPEVSKNYRLSNNPNDRAIAGASSGAICAFNVAWERPNEFRRVLSTIGTYVGLRGGNEFPVLVRKTEPKPLRVLLEDGSNDLNIYGGSWWVANQDMLAALQWAGYDVNHAWGDGGHDGKHAAAVMADALRWLWRDYPEPIRTGRAKERRTDLLIDGQDWQLIGDGYQFTEGPAVNSKGEVFFVDIPSSRILKVGLDDQVTVFAEQTGRVSGLMFDDHGRLWGCAGETKQIVAYAPDGTKSVLAEGIAGNDLAWGAHGVYITAPQSRHVVHVAGDGKTTVVDEGIQFANGVIHSPDHSLLYVADSRGQFVYSFQCQADGTLKYKQPFFHLHLPFGQTESGADGMTVDTDGRLYVATRIGLQVCDQPGRVQFIMPDPGNGPMTNVVFGGPELDTLYITSGKQVFKRKVNVHGIPAGASPQKPPKPRL